MTSRPVEPAPVVEGYELLARLGEGGMGVVHLARSPAGERVALKLLRPHVVGDDEGRRRLAREVSSLRRVRSRWVAEIRDADPWAAVPYVATRYVPGLTLHDHVHTEGPLVGADLRWFAACLAEGIASVHEVGVLHRDVKPANVLMEGRTPILIDFGLARVADDPRLTHTGWLLGTPGYLAPEILWGEDATAASDVHSWAATVGFAATGRSPFGRGPTMAVMDRVRRGQHDLRGVDRALHDVLEAALDPDPLRRPGLAEARDAVAAVAGGAPAAARRPSHPRAELGPTLPVALAGLPDDEAEDDDEDDDEVTEVVRDGSPYDWADDPWDGPGEGPDRGWDDGGWQDGGWQDGGWDDGGWDDQATAVVPPDHTRRLAPHADEHHPSARDYPPDLWDPRGFETPPVPVAERMRRAAVVLAGGVVLAAALAAAPVLSLAATLVLVWLLRSGSLAASAVDGRRLRRGRRWYDSLQLLVQTPWHLLAAVPGSLLLLGWGLGVVSVVGLIGYAVALSAATTIFLGGLGLAGALWLGPGGHRLRGPLARVVHPISRGTGSWLLTIALLAVAAGVLGALLGSNGISWTPFTDARLPR